MISIILPTFNEEHTIESSLRQFIKLKKKFDLELIVSDGGSTDNTVKIAKKLVDKIVVHQKSWVKTISEGRNKGAAKAKGDIIIFFDADVRLENPEKFFNAVIEKFKDPKIVGATCRTRAHLDEEKTFDRIFYSTMSSYIMFLNFIGVGASWGCQMVRKKTFDKLKGYDCYLVAGEDFEFFHRLAKEGRIYFFNKLIIRKSPRRFRKLGYPRVLWQWFLNYLFSFFGKAYSKEWKPVR
ncbi:MAG: glycosyltransferase [Candidatus Woesearchaeota archaeon]|nr:glycosyltransferase [Candidatus Woesearchaeota archaeon]